jgi:hypothetical protein
MEDTIIKFQTAILAREKGFEEKTCHWYNTNKEGTENTDQLRTCAPLNHNFKAWDWNTVSVPTQSLLQKWLREKHGIHIVIDNSITGYYSLLKSGRELSSKWVNNQGCPCSTYEEALEAGLQEGLKLIK